MLAEKIKRIEKPLKVKRKGLFEIKTNQPYCHWLADIDIAKKKNKSCKDSRSASINHYLPS